MADVFGFRPGRSIKNVDAQTVGETLERLRLEKGRLVASDVLELATDPASPLHPAFEWDDSAAAQNWRLNQARKLIVSIRVLNGAVQKPIPVYVSVRTPEGRQFVPTIDALSDEELRTRVLVEVRTFIESLERRYAGFKEVSQVLENLKKNVG